MPAVRPHYSAARLGMTTPKPREVKADRGQELEMDPQEEPQAHNSEGKKEK